MKRRKFLLIIVGAAIILAIGSFSFLISFERVVKMLLEANTRNLKVTQTQIDKFIAEASVEKYWNLFSKPKQYFIIVHYFLENQLLDFPYANKYRQYKNEIIGRFLLSTDFFSSKIDPEKDLNYVGFFNPYKMGCSNPFSSSR